MMRLLVLKPLPKPLQEFPFTAHQLLNVPRLREKIFLNSSLRPRFCEERSSASCVKRCQREPVFLPLNIWELKPVSLLLHPFLLRKNVQNI